VKPKEKKLQEGINKCEEMIQQLEINSTTTQTQINELFNNIRIKLDEKEQELLNKLDEIEKYKKKELELQIEELKFGIESIIGSCQMIENSLSLSKKNKNDLQLISMKNLYESRLNYLSNNIWRMEPCQNSFIDFFSLRNEKESIYSSISNIGMIDSNEISSDKCLILRDEKERIYKHKEFKFEIISYSKDGNQMKNGGNGMKFGIKIKNELKSNNQKSEKYEWKIMDLNNGRYEVIMKLKDEGKYLIFIEYDGINLPSSPLQIQVFLKLKPRNYNEINQPKLTFGSEGNENGQFNGLREVTTDLSGNIIICDFSNNRIQIFDSNGNFISKFGTKGNGNGQFNCPFGIAIDSKGNIVVSDFSNNRIQIFDSNGNFISKFGSQGNGNGQFNSPVAIAIDSNDNILVCDMSNNRIQIFDSEGNFISKFGSQGNGNGQFNHPVEMAINSKGNIIVGDQRDNQIQIFDSEGIFISKFGSKGNEIGQFNCPWGVCVDLNDNILVCDCGNNRIQIFNSNGEYITQFKVVRPTCITINPKTQEIIVCGKDNKILIF